LSADKGGPCTVGMSVDVPCTWMLAALTTDGKVERLEFDGLADNAIAAARGGYCSERATFFHTSGIKTPTD
jgi:hypothetical protein